MFLNKPHNLHDVSLFERPFGFLEEMDLRCRRVTAMNVDALNSELLCELLDEFMAPINLVRERFQISPIGRGGVLIAVNNILQLFQDSFESSDDVDNIENISPCILKKPAVLNAHSMRLRYFRLIGLLLRRLPRC